MRRVHRKTRTGCTQCKRRRIKCDERKPRCENCDRQQLQCSLEFLTPAVSPYRNVSGHITSHAMRAYSLSWQLSPSTLDPQTNELLHHYSTVLYDLLADQCPPKVWCVTIPQLGLEHNFISSGIFALSALHLSTVVPQRRKQLYLLALVEESSGVSSFRSLMKNPKSNDIHAIFVFAASVVIYTMGSPNQFDRCRLPGRQDEHPHWFHTTRGFMTVLDDNWEQLAGGPVGSMIYRKEVDEDHAAKNPDDRHLRKLHGMFNLDNSLSSHMSKRYTEICLEALEDLRQASGLADYSTSNSQILVRIWPGRLSQEFVELVYSKDPRALVILAHYCVLLKRSNHVWYMEGLGVGLLESIREALPEEFLPWIEWALEYPVSVKK